MQIRTIIPQLWLIGLSSLAFNPTVAAEWPQGQHAYTEGQTSVRTIQEVSDVRATARKYMLFTPANSDTRPKPLVIVLHGGGGNGQQAMKMSNWNDEAQRRGWLVAYPYGSGKLGNRLLTWNAGNCCGYAMERKIDDVAFIDKMISDIAQIQHLDSSRVYVTGISNGAMLAYKLACEMSDKIAAIAPVSGTMDWSSCRPSHSVSVMHFHGTADNNVPFDGGIGSKALNPISKRSVPSTLEDWHKTNRCLPPKITHTHNNVVTFISSKCQNGHEVTLAKIDGGGHAWPGSQVSYAMLDKSSQELDATKEMALFFSKH